MAYNGSKSGGPNGSIHSGIFNHGEQRPREDGRSREEEPPPYYFENGRAYQTFCKERYMLPCDEEEMDRMDIFHRFFQVAREKDTPFGSLHQLPLPAQPRILDLGCGTGIWAIDMADRYNSSGVVAAEVIGWDLALIQPPRIPPGLTFEKRDVEDMPWRGVNRDYFDLIHVQMLLGSIGNWPALYGQILRHLKPGSGILEQVEIDLRPRSERGELPGNTKLSLWTRELGEAFDRAGTPLGMDPKTQALLEDLGFVDVKQETKRIPCNAWPDDEHEKDMGRWFNLALTQGLQAMSYGPLTRKLHYNKDQVDALVAEVRREICDRNLRAYCTMHIWTARRPAAGGQRP